MTLADVLFYLFAAGILAGAGLVAFSRNILRSALGLLASLAGMGVVYAFLAADFLAVTQMLVYVGGVVVLILFAIMLTSRIGQQGVTNRGSGIWGGAGLLAVVAPVLVAGSVAAPWATRTPTEASPTTAVLGNALLTQYLFPFELASLVLLATLVGAVVIARKEMKRDEDEPGAVAKGGAR